MPLSYQSITNPSSTSFTVSFEFLNLADIKAVGKLNSASEWTELPVTDAATSNGVTTVTVADAGTYSSAGEVRIYRASSQAPLVDFQNGSRLSESDLDTAYRQGLFAAQEVRENAADSITAVGPQGPAGAAGADGADGAVNHFATTGFRAYNSGSQLMEHDADKLIEMNQKSFDLGSKFDTSTYKYTPASVGYYHLRAQLKFNFQDSSLGRRMQVWITKNGSKIAQNYHVFADGSDNLNEHNLSVSTLFYCDNVSNYYQVYGMLNNANGSDNAYVIQGEIDTYFEGWRVF
jgi:hypothetical protein